MVAALLVATVLAATPASALTGGYPNHDARPYNTSVYEWWLDENGNGRADAPGELMSSRGYYYRNCTDYVAWKLRQRGVSIELVQGNGNGGQWDDRNSGRIKSTPKTGMVAVSDLWGHVAFVEAVHSDGTITVSEYNIPGGSGAYNTRRGTKSELKISAYVDFGATGGTTTTSGGINKNYTFKGTNSLTAGMELRPGQYILTGNVKAYLVLQGDGNLVLYGPGNKAWWSSKTNGQKIKRAVMQGDGNFVLYRDNGSAAWSSRTNGHPGARLVLQNDGNLVVYAKGGGAKWSSKTNGKISTGPGVEFKGKMTSGNTLYRGQALRGGDKRRILVLQNDGNLVLYGPAKHVLWKSKTAGIGVKRAVMQGDGNFVLYKHGGAAPWSTRTNGYPGARITVQSDGNVVVYDTNGNARWASGTNGKL